MAGNGVVLTDAQGNLVSGYGNQALGTTQPALVQAGSDYTSSPKAQVPKVDAYGTQYVSVATPSGNPSQVYTGQASPAAANQYGNLNMLRMDTPAPSVFNPALSDMLGSMHVHHRSKPTGRVVVAGIACGQNKNLFALVNNSTMVVRLNEMNIYIPPSGLAGSGLLGGSNNVTYYPVICQIHRITSASGGTTLTPAMTDSNDTLASGIVALSSPTTVSSVVSVFHRQDAYISTISGLPFFFRSDQNEKNMVMRPGEGLAIMCMSSGTINNASGSGTTTAAADIVVVFTQAPG